MSNQPSQFGRDSNAAAEQPKPRGIHLYHATADVISASIREPIQRSVKKEAYVDLPEFGGYEYQQSKHFQIEGLLSYRSGYTQVAGNPSTKHGGVSTLATTVIEGLNVLDVLTADRVVGQIFTEHPEYGSGEVPSVSFLGTRFDNLRIGGHEVKLTPVLDILGARPEDDRSYFQSDSILGRLETQYSDMNRSELPKWAQQDYTFDKSSIQANNQMRCSLFSGVSLNGNSSAGASRESADSNGAAPNDAKAPTCFGHVIDLPFFGKIFLGELSVTRVPRVGEAEDGVKNPDTYSFHITMIRLKLGCPVVANVNLGTADSNGGGSGGHH